MHFEGELIFVLFCSVMKEVSIRLTSMLLKIKKDKALHVAMPLHGKTKPQARELNERARET